MSKRSFQTGNSGSSGSISSSFLDLKAELERSKATASSSSSKRKLDDLEERKSKKLSSSFLDSTSMKPTKPNKSSLSSIPSSKGKKRTTAAENTAEPTTSQLNSIRANLERKARIYSQLQAGKYAGLSSDQLKEGSIDWERKLAEAQNDNLPHHSDDDDDEYITHNTGEEGDPEIEYVDEFGRTRKAPLSEIPRDLLPAKYGGDKQDEEGEGEDNAIYGPSTSFPVYDPTAYRRERAEREKREKHFNASFENRYRGAAFYRFAQEEEERRTQMSQLKQLRDETVAQREARGLGDQRGRNGRRR
ncbi:uncharacterized protein UTRI_03847 [Ustilago trichophora]|uniref:Uncharacterized protein n=1 Tax=Ustilago trichophora TaxID=86804 RepID=A0A5C3E2F2_9BASI|nr:uncharacterized protein UTRI_03847 [Ustilago trichophora]